MIKMEEIAKLVATYGGLVILAVLFIIDWRESKKDAKEEKKKSDQVLEELAKSNGNIAESLNLLKVSLDNTNSEFRQHDERSIKEFSEIKQEIIKLRSDKK